MLKLVNEKTHKIDWRRGEVLACRKRVYPRQFKDKLHVLARWRQVVM